MANATNTNTVGIVGFTGTAMAGSPATQYTVQVGGSTTSTLSSIGTGSAGQVLQSAGNAANPAYSTATYPATAGTALNVLTSDGTNIVSTAPGTAGSSLVLLQTSTASASASLDFTTGITSTYDVYFLEISRLVPATDAAFLTMQVSTDGGSSWKVTGYLSGTMINSYNSNALNNNNTTTSFYLAPTLSNSSAVGTTNISAKIHNMGSANFVSLEGTSQVNVTSGSIYFGYLGGVAQHNSVNAIRIIMSSGNITSGVVSLYGLRK